MIKNIPLPDTNYIRTAVNAAIASVWFINGLFCKVLNLAPRHTMIVGSILGAAHSRSLTIIIGSLEILMAVWVLGRFSSRWCAITQVVIIATMNILECVFVPHLLLLGYINPVLAGLLIIVILLNEFAPGAATVPKQ